MKNYANRKILLAFVTAFAMFAACATNADAPQPDNYTEEPQASIHVPEINEEESPEAEPTAPVFVECGLLPCVCPPRGTGETVAAVVFEGVFAALPGGDWYEGNAIAPLDYSWGGPTEWTEHAAFMTMDLHLLEKHEARLIIEHDGTLSGILPRDGGTHGWGGVVVSRDISGESTRGKAVFKGEDILGAHWARTEVGNPIMYMNVQGETFTITRISVEYADFEINPDSVVTGIQIASAGKTEYALGEPLDLSATTLDITLASGKTAYGVPVTEDMLVGFSTAAANRSRTVTVVYPRTDAAMAFTDSFVISVGGVFTPLTPNRPFPQADVNASLAVNLLKPTGVSQAQMNQSIIEKFISMLDDFLIDPDPETVNDPFAFRMVLDHDASGLTDAPPGGTQTTCSESMGYGMLALALMAGADAEAGIDVKGYFDGMFRAVRHWTATVNGGRYHIAWEIVNDSKWKTDHGNTSWRAPASRYGGSSASTATDGSLDTAYALVLASRQWEESNDGVNYLDYAKEMIGEIWRLEVRHDENAGYWLNRGSWDTRGMSTRPSDHMMHHLKVFAALDPDNNWQGLIDDTYAGQLSIIRRQDPPNGLLPDFVVIGADGNWEAPTGRLLESANDGDYHWNACRVPWRLGVDAMFSGETPVSGLAVKRLNELQEEWANGNFNNIRGRKLDGTRNAPSGSAFSGPALVPAAIFGPQAWFDAGWAYATELPWQGNKYGDYILLLTMIAASGNEWNPAL
jgi:endo-1,4-beta-D-glucanase Y